MWYDNGLWLDRTLENNLYKQGSKRLAEMLRQNKKQNFVNVLTSCQKQKKAVHELLKLYYLAEQRNSAKLLNNLLDQLNLREQVLAQLAVAQLAVAQLAAQAQKAKS